MVRRRDCYRCRPCDRVFIDQIRYEQHLARDHGRLRDTLPAVQGALEE